MAVVDDQDIIRFGVQQYLSNAPFVTLCGSFADLDMFFQVPACRDADIVILDDTLPYRTVYQSVREIRNQCPETAILILGSQLDAHTIQNLIAQDVLGFVCKEEEMDGTLIMGVRRLHDRKIYLSPEAALISSQSSHGGSLSPRLLQVLSLIAQGAHIRQMALELGIGPRAVYAARARLRDALGVRTDAQVVAEAIRRGLLKDW